MVKSEKAYSPQNFLEEVTGKCYLLRSDTLKGLVSEMAKILLGNGFFLESFDLSDIGYIVQEKYDVVLVELTGEDENGNWTTVYRWHQVPDDFKED